MEEHSHEGHAHIDLPLINLKPGPVIWCKYCSRHHPRRQDCGLVPVERISKAGNKVIRLAHPEKKKPLRKKRVRKS
jgi:hypothetical protein